MNLMITQQKANFSEKIMATIFSIAHSKLTERL